MLGPRPAGVGPAGLGRPGVEAAPFICSMPRRARGGGCSLHLLYAPAGMGRRPLPPCALCPGGHGAEAVPYICSTPRRPHAPACMRAMPLRACALCPCVHARYAPACMRTMLFPNFACYGRSRPCPLRLPGDRAHTGVCPKSCHASAEPCQASRRHGMIFFKHGIEFYFAGEKSCHAAGFFEAPRKTN